MTTCDSMLLIVSKQFFLPNFIHKDWVTHVWFFNHFPNVPHIGIVSPGRYYQVNTSKNQPWWDSNLVFMVNILTTWKYTHLLKYTLYLICEYQVVFNIFLILELITLFLSTTRSLTSLKVKSQSINFKLMIIL